MVTGTAGMIYKTYDDLSDVIHKNLSILSSEKFDLIVGVPRSGMIPALMIAADLQISVCSMTDLLNNNTIQRLGRRIIKDEVTQPHEAKKILIVEDSWGGGGKFIELVKSLPRSIQKKVSTLAIYSAETTANVDFAFELVPKPRLFEWNIYHHEVMLGNSCFDMDGVLCEDPTNDQNDDSYEYLKFIESAAPKWIPVYTIKTIVTSRLEKYRKPTEQWLKRNNVKYDKLIMLEGYTAEERARQGIHGAFKALEYAKDDYSHPYSLFVESNPHQAIEINRITNKPVFCTENNTLINAVVVESTNFHSPVPTRKAVKDFAKAHTILRIITKPIYKVYKRTRKLIRRNKTS